MRRSGGGRQPVQRKCHRCLGHVPQPGKRLLQRGKSGWTGRRPLGKHAGGVAVPDAMTAIRGSPAGVAIMIAGRIVQHARRNGPGRAEVGHPDEESAAGR